jgi:hypothetical protein
MVVVIKGQFWELFHSLGGLPVEASFDALGDLVAQRAEWIVRSIYISAGRCDATVPKQIANLKCIWIGVAGERAEGVSQIMQAHILDPGDIPYSLPCLLDRALGKRPLRIVA